MSAATPARHPITSLPLPAKTLQNTLLPIPLPHRSSPSSQRRSQTFSKTGAWARTTPLPVMFPYRVPRADVEKGEVQVGIEEWLGAWDDWVELEEGESSPASQERTGNDEIKLKTYTSRLREAALPTAQFIAVSPGCLSDHLPHLSVGNALEQVTSASASTTASGDQDNCDLDKDAQSLLDVLSGKNVLLSLPTRPTSFSTTPNEDPEFDSDLEELSRAWDEGQEGYGGYGPWSMRYAGHQFGVWAGQLGDGRAVSILETQSPTSGHLELQLKGSGRTPFSRSADGLAVLRSGIREFLGAEAVAALGIATSRSLALLTHSNTDSDDKAANHPPTIGMTVMRENGPEQSSLLCRTARSFIRIGNFEILNPPEDSMNMQFFMMGAGSASSSRSLQPDYEGLRRLGEWVVRPGGLDLGLGEEKAWGWELVKESARRNARMVAGWQVQGFCHGVINTDNVSVLGITIDYGPYAFLDIYDPYHICNHSDNEGRYDYRKQPTMILYAMRSLLSSLSPLIGCEEGLGGKAVKRGWAEEVDEDVLEEWRNVGTGKEEELEKLVLGEFKAEYKRLFSERFGLLTQQDDDLSKIIDPFLTIMKDNELDFHATLRALCFFKPSVMNDSDQKASVVDRIIANMPRGTTQKREAAKSELGPWLEVYAKRIVAEQEQWKEKSAQDWEAARQKEMRLHNPRFVLRQWVLEETIKEVTEATGREKQTMLSEILALAARPFESYGEEVSDDSTLMEQQAREERLCGTGSTKMLGFQCSCSS